MIADGRNEALSDETTVYFTVSGIERMDFSFLLSLDGIKHTTLLSHRPSSRLDYEVLFTSGEKDIFGGNYFEENAFTDGIVSIVLGQYLEENGEEAEKLREEAQRMGKKAVVTGKLPPSVNAAWNYSVFYTYGQLKEVDVTSVLALSSTEKRYLEPAREVLFREISARGGTALLCHFRQIEYQDFFRWNKLNNVLLLGVVLIVFLAEWASVYVTFLWRGALRTVQFLLGEKGFFFREIRRNFLTLTADVVFGGLLVYLVFRDLVSSSLELLLRCMLLTLLVGSVSIGFLLIFYRRQNPFFSRRRSHGIYKQ
ncbi:MAG: hypothetical protein ACI4QX_04625 [Lachnospiraceae bacterium]